MRRITPWTGTHVAIGILSVLFPIVNIRFDTPFFRAGGITFAILLLARVTLHRRISTFLTYLPFLMSAVMSLYASIVRSLEELHKIQGDLNRNLIHVTLIGVCYSLWLGSHHPHLIGLNLKLRILALYAILRTLSLLIRGARRGRSMFAIYGRSMFAIFVAGDIPVYLSYMGSLASTHSGVRMFANRSAVQIASNALNYALRSPPVIITISLTMAVLSDVRGFAFAMSEIMVVRLGMISIMFLGISWLNGLDRITTSLSLLLPIAMATVGLLNALCQPEQAMVDQATIYLQLGYATQVSIACIAASYGTWIGSRSLDSVSFPAKLMIVFLSVALHLCTILIEMIRIGAVLPDKHAFELPFLIVDLPFVATCLVTMTNPRYDRIPLSALDDVGDFGDDEITPCGRDEIGPTVRRDETEPDHRSSEVNGGCRCEGRGGMLRKTKNTLVDLAKVHYNNLPWRTRSSAIFYCWIAYASFFGSYFFCAITKNND